MEIIRVIKKVGLILSRHQKRRIIELGIMMVIGGLLETCSVSFILPFMNAISNPEEIMNMRYAKVICTALKLQSPRAFLVVAAIMLAVLYVFKNLYLMLEYDIQYRFVYGNMFALQKKLLEIFIHRPYEYFLEVSSGEMLRIVGDDTARAFNILITLLQLHTELVVSIMLIAAIFVIMPMVTTCIAFLLIFLMIFMYVVVKPILRRAAQNQQESSAGMNKWLLQSIQGIKELKVMQKECFFQENFNRNGQIYVRSLRRSQTLGVVPRFMIEGVCMGAMFIVVAVIIYQGMEFESFIPMLTAVAMAAIRLLPSVNRISGALAQIAYGEPMLDKVVENLRLMEDGFGEGRTMESKTNSREDDGNVSKTVVSKLHNAVDFHEITYCYPKSDDNVLTLASMIIHRGESIGIVGPSGAGKTTAVDIILGLLAPQQGQVLVDGMDIKEDPASWLRQIGYIPQMIFMLDDTIRVNIAFGEESIDDANVWNALKEAELAEFVTNLPEGLDTEIGERGIRLSGGQRQRIGIARALYRNPEVLIFDEATSALDRDTEAAIMESIHNLHGQKTMIIIAHRLTTIEACDHIYRVENHMITKQR